MQSDLELLEALLNPHQTHPPTSLTSTSQHQELLEEACSYLTKTRWRQCVGQEGSGDCRHIAPICAPWMFTLSWAHERSVPAILFLSRAWFGFQKNGLVPTVNQLHADFFTCHSLF